MLIISPKIWGWGAFWRTKCSSVTDLLVASTVTFSQTASADMFSLHSCVIIKAAIYMFHIYEPTTNHFRNNSSYHGTLWAAEAGWQESHSEKVLRRHLEPKSEKNDGSVIDSSPWVTKRSVSYKLLFNHSKTCYRYLKRSASVKVPNVSVSYSHTSLKSKMKNHGF